MKTVIFDIGGVLVDWQPHMAWMHTLGSRADVDAFMTRISFTEKNIRADNGERFDDLAAELDNEDDAQLLRAYVPNYQRTVQDRIEESWAILDQLKQNGTPVHAITNWSAETWPEGLKAQPRLAEVFGVTVVSGQEGVMKPDARIFQMLCDRAGIAPSDAIFIDDGPHNVDGARAVGMDGIHFTSPQALSQALQTRGVL